MRKTLAFLAMLTGVFAALKLANWISWSWWWVSAPMWLPFAAVAGIMMAVLMVVIIKDGGAK
jgi:hypothetical protein